MNTSQTVGLSKPEGATKISLGTLGYVRARNRQRAYNVVIRELRNSGITQADLARRLGKGAEVISRLLARPRNWELDTYSDLLFGISGKVPKYETDNPLGSHVGDTTQITINPKQPSTVSDLPDIVRLNVKSNNPQIVICELVAA